MPDPNELFHVNPPNPIQPIYNQRFIPSGNPAEIEIFDRAKLILRSQGIERITPLFYKESTTDQARAEKQALLGSGPGISKNNKGINQFNSFPGFMFDTIIFESNGAILASNAGNVDPFNTIEFSTALIDLTQTKNVVTTRLSGRNGTVKEYISDGDYYVSIRGIIFSGANNVYPDAEIKAFYKMCAIPASIKVTSNMLNNYGINYLTIMEYETHQMEGDRTMVPFSMKCISDMI